MPPQGRDPYQPMPPVSEPVPPQQTLQQPPTAVPSVSAAATNTPTSDSAKTTTSQAASSPTQAGSVLYNCSASYVTGKSGYSYRPGTLRLYQDHLAIVSKANATLLEILYSDITQVEYRKSFKTKLFTIQTRNGVQQIAPFTTMGSSPLKLGASILGIVVIQQTLDHLGGATVAVIIPILLLIAIISFVQYYRKLARTSRQIIAVLGQYVPVKS